MLQISYAIAKPKNLRYKARCLGAKFLYGVKLRNRWQNSPFCHLSLISIYQPFSHIICISFRYRDIGNTLNTELDVYTLLVTMEDLCVVEVYHIGAVAWFANSMIWTKHTLKTMVWIHTNQKNKKIKLNLQLVL